MPSSDNRQAVVDMATALRNVYKKYNRETRRKAWRALTSKKGQEEMAKLINQTTRPVSHFRSLSFREWILEEMEFEDLTALQRGYDDTAYAINTFDKPDMTVEEWVERIMAKTIDRSQHDPYLKGVVEACKKFLNDGSIEPIGMSYEEPEEYEKPLAQKGLVGGPFSRN